MRKVLLVSTYELGRQPFGLASPAAWLREAGVDVACVDVSRERLREEAVRGVDVVAFHVPMHTATRMALDVLPKVRAWNPRAHVCFYGLYAIPNEPHLRAQGVDTILGGEYEEALVRLAQGLGEGETSLSKARQKFRVPDRTGLPALSEYAGLQTADGVRTAAHTEASRGCKHLCRHCPIVPVYQGAFRLVQADVVLEDVRRQVAAGALHVTFGDPDFFNSVRHAMQIVRALHAELPHLTWDATIKVEHLLDHADLLPEMVRSGCAFVTSAVESVDDVVLEKLDKGHTRADFERVVGLCRGAGLGLTPTFVPFTPWTTPAGYVELLRALAALDLVDCVAPVQLAIRLLVPARSRLLELPEIADLVGDRFDPAALLYRWTHRDPRVDALCEEVQALVWKDAQEDAPRGDTFRSVWDLAHDVAGINDAPALPDRPSRSVIPYLDEPWYC